MKTNLEKWNYYMGVLTEKANSFMDDMNPLIPSVFYRIGGAGKIDKCTTIKRHYSFGLYFSGKKPSNKDVQKISDFINTEIIFTADKVYFDYSYVWGAHDGKELFASTSINIIDLFGKEKAFLSLEDAEIKSKQVIERIREENIFYDTHKKDVGYDYSVNGYKFLGWQNGWNSVYFDVDGNITEDISKRKTFGYLSADHPEYGNCKELKHRKIEVQHNSRGSENTVSCPVCKIYWKYDCSD